MKFSNMQVELNELKQESLATVSIQKKIEEMDELLYEIQSEIDV